MAKKSKTKKKASKKQVQRQQSVLIKVQAFPATVPTVEDLAQPMKEGRELAITKTWVSDKQIMRMVQKTPPQYVYSRPAKGGGRWSYVTGSYVEKVLNFVFGFMWDFEIVEHGKEEGMVWVKGKLTVKDPKGNTITKMQFGRADIKFRKDSKIMLDYGNDLKAASTDALKKCASLLGIASDIYGSSEYKEETGTEPRQNGNSGNNPPPQLPPAKTEEIYCHGARKAGCPDGTQITQQEHDYSKKIYGKPLCRECQKQATPITKK